MTSSVVACLAALDPTTNPKGQKNANIVRDGSQAFWLISSPVQPLWQPSAFKGVSGDATGRLSLCLMGTADVLAEATALDEWAVDYAFQHSERLFGKALTKDQVSDRYNSVLKKADKYPSYIKVKLGTERNAPKYWDESKQPRDAPTDFMACSLQCKLRIVSLWFMNTSFGLTVQLQDAQVVSEHAQTCPF